MSADRDGRIVALCGGVGGAKLALGLMHRLGERLTVIVNVGDDFVHYGLPISPDIDTVLYTLGGVSHTGQGWGRADESWAVLDALARDFGEEPWFRLGDRDIALHLFRLRDLQAGLTLSETVDRLRRALGIAARIAPATDQPLRTVLDTSAGEIGFQDYFVRRRCAPALRGIRHDGADAARLGPAAAEALADSRLRGIIVCPSNPLLSIGPMLAIAQLRTLLRARRCPVVAVSPLVGGKAIKGPTERNLAELGHDSSVTGIARLYEGLCDAMLIDGRDTDAADGLTALGMEAIVAAPLVMETLEDRIALADAALAAIDRLAPAGPEPTRT